jgi:hypothetical protein
MKPQKFFGGTTPHNTGKDKTQRQVGHFSATPGVNHISNNRGQADTKAYKPKTGKFTRPNIPGKVDNRKVGQ